MGTEVRWAFTRAGQAPERLLLRARQRGVAVRVLADQEQARQGRRCADGRVVAFGSFNFTAQAARRNDEVLAVVESPDLARAWTAVFEHLWNDRLGFRDLDVRPPVCYTGGGPMPAGRKKRTPPGSRVSPAAF